MTSRKKARPTDDQVEAEVLAKRGDPAAWEILPFVPASSSPRPSWMLRRKHLELAGKFHVLSALHRFGIEANLALAQPDNVDISVLGRAGSAITIDVKIVQGAEEWVVDQFTARKHHYVVVVAFPVGANGVVAQPEAYVVASEVLHKFIVRRKLARVSLETLAKELAALEAWEVIAAEQAA
jgi:hypothetical protein